jgi:hypothetical protein
MEGRAVRHNFERGPPCQVWFNLVQRFQWQYRSDYAGGQDEWAMETGLFRPDGRRRVYRRRGERFADACVLERDRFGGGSVMVWGGISHGLKSPLIVTAGY